VNASFEDIAKGIGCSTKTVQRALEELEEEFFVDNVHVSARAPVLSHVAAV
jgi:DNA-binding transcriptional regulator YhcF (GntR family)